MMSARKILQDIDVSNLMLNILPGKKLALLSLVASLAACSESDNRGTVSITVTDTTPQADVGEVPLIDPQASLLERLDGSPVRLADFAGQHILLNYWATWCAPCIEEIPSLLNAAEQLGDDFEVLLVSDESAEKILDFLEDHEFGGNFLRLNQFFMVHGVSAVPSTVLYRADGEPAAHWLGAKEWDSSGMLTEIREAVE